MFREDLSENWANLIFRKNRPKHDLFSLFKPPTCPFSAPPSSKQTPTTHQNVQSSTISTRSFNFSPPTLIFSLFFHPQSKMFLSLTEMQTRRCWNTKISTSFALPQKNSKFHPCSESMNESKSMSKTRFRKFGHTFFGISFRQRSTLTWSSAAIVVRRNHFFKLKVETRHDVAAARQLHACKFWGSEPWIWVSCRAVVEDVN